MALFDALHASIYIFFHLFFMCCREVRAFYTTVIRKMFAKFPYDCEVLKDLVVMDLSKRADITYAPSKFLSINTNGKICPCCTVNESTKCVLIPFICHHYQSVFIINLFLIPLIFIIINLFLIPIIFIIINLFLIPLIFIIINLFLIPFICYLYQSVDLIPFICHHHYQSVSVFLTICE